MAVAREFIVNNAFFTAPGPVAGNLKASNAHGQVGPNLPTPCTGSNDAAPAFYYVKGRIQLTFCYQEKLRYTQLVFPSGFATKYLREGRSLAYIAFDLKGRISCRKTYIRSRLSHRSFLRGILRLDLLSCANLGRALMRRELVPASLRGGSRRSIPN